MSHETEESEFLDEWIAELAAAVEGLMPGPDRLAAKGDLGIALLHRYERDGGEDDFGRGRDLLAAVLDEAPGHPDADGWVWILSQAYFEHSERHESAVDLDVAIGYLRRLHARGHEGDVALAQASLYRYELTQSRADLDAAIELLVPVAAAAQTQPGPDMSLAMMAASALAEAYRIRSLLDEDQASLTLALTVLAEAIGDVDAGTPVPRALLVQRALALELCWERSADAADLEAAVEGWRKLVIPDPDGQVTEVAIAESAARLGWLLRERYRVLIAQDAGEEQIAAALSEAIGVLQQAHESLPRQSPTVPETGWRLGLSWLDRYGTSKDPLDLQRGITEIEQAAKLVGLDETQELNPEPLLVMAKALHERAGLAWDASGGPVGEPVKADLAAAMQWARRGVNVLDAQDPMREDALLLAILIGKSYGELAPQEADLATLAAWTEELVTRYNGDGHDREMRDMAIALHASALALRVERDGDQSVTAEVTGYFNDALAVMRRRLGEDGPRNYLNQPLSPGVATLVNASMAPARYAAAANALLAKPKSLERAKSLGMLALAAVLGHQSGHFDIDIDLLITMVTEALAVDTDDTEWQSSMRMMLAQLQVLAAGRHDPGRVVEPIDLLHSEVGGSATHSSLAMALLSDAYQIRGHSTGEIPDLQAALGHAESALAELPPGDSMVLTVRIQRGVICARLGFRKHDPDLVRRGAGELRACLEELDTHDVRRASVLATLASVEVWQVNGSPAESDVIARGARLAEEAANAPGQSASSKAALDSYAATFEALGAASIGDLAGVESAVGALRTTLGDLDGIEMVKARMGIGGMLVGLATARRSREDMDDGIAELEFAHSKMAEDIANPLWGELNFALGQAYRARVSLSSGVQAPGELSDEGTDRARSRHHGRQALRAHAWQVLVQDSTDHAAASAKNAAGRAVTVAGWCADDGRAAEAAGALDAGRGLILQAAALASHLRPDAPRDTRGQRLRAIIGEVDGPGETGVLDPPLLAKVRSALSTSSAQALVYLVGQSDDVAPMAVILPERGEPAVVTLPMIGVGPPEFQGALASAYPRHFRDFKASGSDDSLAGGLAETLPALTHWAYQAVMKRVLDHCRLAGYSRPYRLVLVPMGELGLIPWHAARSPDGRYVIEEAIISYAVSARLFCEVIGRGAVPAGAGSLIVADPTGTLHHAGNEAQAIHDEFYPSSLYLGRDATPARVLNWLRGSVNEPRDTLHLACHGLVGTGSDSSLLILANEEMLSAEQLLGAGVEIGACQVGLVSLAACSTGVSARGYDEAFSLATAFQVAGARSVVSSLWRVPDDTTSLLMYMLHHYLRTDHLAPATALRQAQLWMLDPVRRLPKQMPQVLRRQAADIRFDTVAWAGFMHLGQW